MLSIITFECITRPRLAVLFDRSFCHSFCLRTGERVNARRQNMIGVGKGHPLEVITFWCWTVSGLGSVFHLPWHWQIRILRYALCPKNETRILNILYSCISLLQWNLACDIGMTFAIKRIHNLPPHLSYVSTTWHYTKQHLRCPLTVGEWLWKESVLVCLKWLWGGWPNHSRCSKWPPFAFTHACSHVCHWLRRWCPAWGIRSQLSMSLCFSWSMPFRFCVMSGRASVETIRPY